MREDINALIEEPSYRLAAAQIAAEIAALPGLDEEIEFLTDLAAPPRSLA